MSHRRFFRPGTPGVPVMNQAVYRARACKACLRVEHKIGSSLRCSPANRRFMRENTSKFRWKIGVDTRIAQ